jgi:hypothetical protein
MSRLFGVPPDWEYCEAPLDLICCLKSNDSPSIVICHTHCVRVSIPYFGTGGKNVRVFVRVTDGVCQTRGSGDW